MAALPHIIFVTAARWTPGGGASTANTACNSDTNKPASYASTTFKALLNGNSATVSGTSYYQKDGTTLIAVATSGNLIAGSNGSNPTSDLTNPITKDYVGGNVWTGAGSNNCNNWASSQSSDNAGVGSQASKEVIATWWNNNGPITCNTQAFLDCVSQ